MNRNSMCRGVAVMLSLASTPACDGGPQTAPANLQDIMSRDIKTIGPQATASEARSAMRESRVRHLLVVDKRAVAGIVSDRDLGGRTGAGKNGLKRSEPARLRSRRSRI